MMAYQLPAKFSLKKMEVPDNPIHHQQRQTLFLPDTESLATLLGYAVLTYCKLKPGMAKVGLSAGLRMRHVDRAEKNGAKK